MVTIIIPVYNTENYLKKCIDSVLEQTDTDWELILVDDESTDNSGKICDEYALKDNRIKVVHQKNSGPAAARQAGLAVAKGEWIMFADSDDWLDKDILKVLKENQMDSQANIVCCTFVNMDENDNKHHIPYFEQEYIDCFTVRDCIYHMHATRYLTGSPCTKLFRKSLFEGIDFCKDVTIGEDYSMIVQLVQKAERVRMLKAELYYRFVRKGSISHMGYSERHKKAFDNYMRVRLELIDKYPDLKKDIIGFHTEYEMAVITAMCRNKNYDWNVINKLKTDLRENMKLTWSNSVIPLYMKMCAWLIAYPTRLFIILFRLLYLCTGR
jgi:glycosyltransferase involved in cell wall biosynthesis